MTTVLPSVAVLEMTYRCNHACRFCSCPWFAGMLKPGDELEVDEWKRLIEAYSSAGVTQFSFTGGEALLKEGCLELMDFASKRAQAGLLSNGRAMTEDVLRFCAERGIHVMMSMPGLRSFTCRSSTRRFPPRSSRELIRCSSTDSCLAGAAFRTRSSC